VDSPERPRDSGDDAPEPGRWPLPSLGEYVSPDEDMGRVHLRFCGECDQESDRIRSYTLLYPYFAVVVFGWRRAMYLRCPKCMRRHILMHLPVAIVVANILCPIVLVWWGVVFLQTFFRYEE
jgi:hypothetical protein